MDKAGALSRTRMERIRIRAVFWGCRYNGLNNWNFGLGAVSGIIGAMLKLIISILLCQGAGLMGALVTGPNIGGWYQGLEKPWFNPPSWVFAPVWTVLYLLMGVALWRVWSLGWRRHKVRFAILAFLGQLALNAIWSILFFGFHSPFLALLDIVLLWAMLGLTILLFWKLSKFAAALLIPYFAWVGFAGILNYAIWHLNQ